VPSDSNAGMCGRPWQATMLAPFSVWQVEHAAIGEALRWGVQGRRELAVRKGIVSSL